MWRRDGSRGCQRGWSCRAPTPRKPDIPVPYLYVDMGVAVLCASFMSFGVKRRWFALGAALQLAVATYASHVGGQVHYGDWLKVRPPPTHPLGTPFPVPGGLSADGGPPGAHVLPDHRHHRRFPHPGQRCRRVVPAEAPQPLSAVHRPGLPGHLPHLPGTGGTGGAGGDGTEPIPQPQPLSCRPTLCSTARRTGWLT